LYIRDGISRLFGFIGYRSAEEATEAQRYFNNTFIDTSKIIVDFAFTYGDNNIPRPWSKHSKGSSGWKKKEEQQSVKKKSNDIDEEMKPKGAIDEIFSRKRKREETEELKSDKKFAEFMEVATKKKKKLLG